MLASLADVKTYLGISTDDDDTFLTQQITLVSDVIEAYCRRKILEADYSQTFYRGDYNPSKLVELYYFPVSAVTSIEVDEVALDPETYRLHKPTGRITSTEGSFFIGEETIVLYTAGYAELPTPIMSVLSSIVGERYNKKKSGVDLNFGTDVQRISIPGAISIDFDYTLANNERKSTYGTILGNYVNILDDYRSERSVIGSGKLEYVEEIEEA